MLTKGLGQMGRMVTKDLGQKGRMLTKGLGQLRRIVTKDLGQLGRMLTKDAMAATLLVAASPSISPAGELALQKTVPEPSSGHGQNWVPQKR